MKPKQETFQLILIWKCDKLKLIGYLYLYFNWYGIGAGSLVQLHATTAAVILSWGVFSWGEKESKIDHSLHNLGPHFLGKKKSFKIIWGGQYLSGPQTLWEHACIALFCESCDWNSLNWYELWWCKSQLHKQPNWYGLKEWAGAYEKLVFRVRASHAYDTDIQSSQHKHWNKREAETWHK